MRALFAGTGRLPEIVLSQAKEPVLTFSLEHCPPSNIAPDILFRIEQLGTLLERFKVKGVKEVVFAGHVTRPKFDPAEICPATLPLIPLIQKVLGKGDTSAVNAIVKLFEAADIRVVGPESWVESLVAKDIGDMAARAPSVADLSDVEIAKQHLQHLSNADIGQGIAISQGHCLAVEALPGTELTLHGLAHARGLRDMPSGGVFVKMPKADQDLRIDLPAIGPETLQQICDAGLNGIAIAFGKTILIDRQKMIAEANRLNKFIWVFEP